MYKNILAPLKQKIHITQVHTLHSKSTSTDETQAAKTSLASGQQHSKSWHIYLLYSHEKKKNMKPLTQPKIYDKTHDMYTS